MTYAEQNILMPELDPMLKKSAARHSHLCPRQVLGVRMGLAGAQALGLDVPRRDKQLLVIVETDGCFVDGIEAATGCSVGHRTLRVEDYGKVAAAFVAVRTGQAVRLAPRVDIREAARRYAPGQRRRYYAQLEGYQAMPTAELFTVEPVRLKTPVQVLVSRPGVRTECERCGEEIINEREQSIAGETLCLACTGASYYEETADTRELSGALVDGFPKAVMTKARPGRLVLV